MSSGRAEPSVATGGAAAFERRPPPWTRGEVLALLAVLVVAVAARLPGLAFGLDADHLARATLTHQNDELSMAQAVVRHLAGDEDALPGVFLHWGTLGMYLFLAVDGAMLHASADPGSERDAWTANPSRVLLAHRLLSVAASLATLLLVHLLARRLLPSGRAWVATLLLALCYLHAREAHFGTLDSLLSVCTAGVAVASVACLQAGRVRDAAVAFVFVGLAAAVKYSGALLGVLPVLAIVGAARARGARLRGLVRGLLLGALAPLTWLACSPHALTAPGELREILARQSEVVGMRAAAIPGVVRYHLVETFGVGLGAPVAGLALVGLAVLLRRRETRLPAGMLLAAFAMLLTTRTTAVRYGEPLVGFAAIFAAAAITAVASRAFPRRGAMAAAALAVVASAPSIARTAAFARVLLAEDTRVAARGFLDERTPAPEDVLQFASYGTVPYPAHWDFLRMVYRNRTWALDAALALRPRFLVAEVSDPEVRRWGIDVFLAKAGADYVPVWSIDGRVDGASPDLPQHTAGTPDFLVPWAEPWRMTRPGPAITIWERRTEGEADGG